MEDAERKGLFEKAVLAASQTFFDRFESKKAIEDCAKSADERLHLNWKLLDYFGLPPASVGCVA